MPVRMENRRRGDAEHESKQSDQEGAHSNLNRIESLDARMLRIAAALLRRTADLGDAHACPARRLQFGFDVGQKQDAIRWRADRLRNARIGTALAFAPDFGVEKAV